jgi:hypothetical protein
MRKKRDRANKAAKSGKATPAKNLHTSASVGSNDPIAKEVGLLARIRGRWKALGVWKTIIELASALGLLATFLAWFVPDLWQATVVILPKYEIQLSAPNASHRPLHTEFSITNPRNLPLSNVWTEIVLKGMAPTMLALVGPADSVEPSINIEIPLGGESAKTKSVNLIVFGSENERDRLLLQIGRMEAQETLTGWISARDNIPGETRQQLSALTKDGRWISQRENISGATALIRFIAAVPLARSTIVVEESGGLLTDLAVPKELASVPSLAARAFRQVRMRSSSQ